MGKGNPALVFVLIGAFLISFLTAAAVYSYLMIQGKVMPPIDYDLSHAIEDENLMTSLRGKSKSLRLQQDSVGWPQGTKFVNLHDAVRRAREKNEVIMVFYTEEWCEATKTFKSLLRRNPEFVDVSKDLIMVATDGRHHAPEETMLPEDVPRAYMTKRGATPNDPCYIPMSLGGAYVPKIYFVDSQLKLLSQFNSSDEIYPYFYLDIDRLVEVMKRVVQFQRPHEEKEEL